MDSGATAVNVLFPEVHNLKNKTQFSVAFLSFLYIDFFVVLSTLLLRS